MKRTPLVLFFVFALLYSCSSDNDTLTDNLIDDSIRYSVDLDIQSSTFSVTQTPITRSTSTSNMLLQVVIYNESGTVYSDSVYTDTSLSALMDSVGNPQLKLNLPAGKYHLAILHVDEINAYAISSSTLKPSNYDSDYYTNTRGHNRYVYYETTDLSLPSASNTKNSIELKPMWSEIELTVNGITNLQKPTGTDIVRFLYKPHYTGFGIKNKLASEPSFHGQNIFGSPGSYYVNLNDIPAVDTKTFEMYVATGANDSMAISMDYLNNSTEAQDFMTLHSVDFKFSNKLVNGNRYKISGNLTSGSSLSNSSLGISVNPINQNGIQVPFE